MRDLLKLKKVCRTQLLLQFHRRCLEPHLFSPRYWVVGLITEMLSTYFTLSHVNIQPKVPYRTLTKTSQFGLIPF